VTLAMGAVTPRKKPRNFSVRYVFRTQSRKLSYLYVCIRVFTESNGNYSMSVSDQGAYGPRGQAYSGKGGQDTARRRSNFRTISFDPFPLLCWLLSAGYGEILLNTIVLIRFHRHHDSANLRWALQDNGRACQSHERGDSKHQG
jgi:hypothetical protein